MNTSALSNLILIGMPGSGKSTIGVQLAKELGLNFVDSDLLIQSRHQQILQQILDEQGYLKLREYEEEVLVELQLNRDLLATGGSAVYSEKAMRHLQTQGLVVYLQVSLDEVMKRIDNEASRGIARRPEQSLEDVYNERVPLYEKYASVTIDNNEFQPISAIITQIKAAK